MPLSSRSFQPRLILIGLILITLLGAFLRLHTTLNTTVLAPLRADAGEYFSYAYNLQHYGVYSRQLTFLTPSIRPAVQPDAMRSPGYPLFLLPFASAEPTNKTILDITLAQALLGVLMIPLVYLLSKPMLSGIWSLLPPLLVAISPQLVLAGTFVLSESLFTFLFLLTLICTFKILEKPGRWGWAFAAGALLAIAALTRPTVQYLLPIVAAGIYLMAPRFHRIKPAITLVIGFMMVFGPWMMRNYLSLGMLSDPTLTVSTLLHGHYPDFMYQGKPESLGYPYRFDPNATAIGANVGTVLAEILRLFIDQPLTYLRWYLVGKPLAFFSWGDVASTNELFTYPTLQSPYLTDVWFAGLKNAMRVMHALWMLLGLAAVVLCWKSHWLRNGKSKAGIQILAVVVLYFIAVHIVGFPIARYSVPLLPVMYILAVFTLSRVVDLVLKPVSKTD
jgi:4-amino-4-deoxy-L-arabinose transferase-like glycosyltransferase